MAKDAADMAVEYYSKQVIWWESRKTPAIVSISLFIDLIKKKYDKIKQQKWKKRKNQINQKRIEKDIFNIKDIYLNDNLFLKAMYKRDNT